MNEERNSAAHFAAAHPWIFATLAGASGAFFGLIGRAQWWRVPLFFALGFVPAALLWIPRTSMNQQWARGERQDKAFVLTVNLFAVAVAAACVVAIILLVEEPR